MADGNHPNEYETIAYGSGNVSKSPNDDPLETIVFGSGTSRNPSPNMKLSDDALKVGDILCDSYILRARLGRGGMGEVWKADEVYEGEILRTVVIKTLAPNVQNVNEEMTRIQSMFHKIHSLQHQHICPMYAMKSDPKAGTIIVMKFIDGMMLQEYYAQYLRTHDDFPVSEVVKLLLPIAQALDYSHAKKVLHRDVKPQNILVSKDESDGVQLIDFGLVMEMRSSLTAGTTTSHFDTSGTLPYMSPEQWSGDFQDARSDQFSLAIVVYELLAGHLPFTGANMQVLGFQILNKSPDPLLGVPDYVNYALQKALAKNRKERFNSCEEFIRALEDKNITRDVAANLASKKRDGSNTSRNPDDFRNDSSTKQAQGRTGMFIPILIGSGITLLMILFIEVFVLMPQNSRQVVQQSPENEPGYETYNRFMGPVRPINLEEIEAKNEPQTKTEPEVKPETTPEGKPETTPEVKPETAPEVKPETTPEVKQETAPEVKQETTQEVKPETAPEAKPETVPETKPETTPEAKPETVPEVKPETTPEAKPETVPEAKPETEKTPEQILAEAREFVQNEKLEEGRSLYASLSFDDLNDADLEIYLGACEKLGYNVTATKIWEKLLASNPTQEKLLQAIQDALVGKVYQKVLEWSDLVLADDPQNVDIMRCKLFALASLREIIGENDPARKALVLANRLLEMKPEDARSYVDRGFVYMKNPSVFEKAFEFAVKDLTKALEMDPNCIPALLYQGIAERDVYYKPAVAMKYFKAILELDPKHAEVFFQMGITLAEDKPDKALEYLTNYLKIQPERWDVYEKRANIYYELGMNEKALEDCSRCVEYQERNLKIRFLRAQTEIRLKYWRDAKEDLEFLIANDTDKNNQVKYYNALAEMFDGAGKKRQAQNARDMAEKIRLSII